jgi:hypothetical protein
MIVEKKRTHKIFIHELPNKVQQSKRKVAYISWNTLFSSPHHTVRTKLVNEMKKIIEPYLASLVLLNPPVAIHLKYYCNRTAYDIDNKTIWFKIIMDVLKGWKLEDDTVKFVKSVSIEAIVHKNKIDAMEIIITEL